MLDDGQVHYLGDTFPVQRVQKLDETQMGDFESLSSKVKMLAKNQSNRSQGSAPYRLWGAAISKILLPKRREDEQEKLRSGKRKR